MGDDILYGRGRITQFTEKALHRKGIPARPLPIVLLWGPHGSGGSGVVNGLWERFSEKCLSVRLNLASAQSVEDIVLAVTHGLGRKIFGIKKIEFPRTGMLFKALSFVGDGGRPAFEAYLRKSPAQAAPQSALNTMAANAATLFLGPQQQAVVRTVTSLLGALHSAVGRSHDRRTLAWLAEYGTSHAHDGYDSLWDLYCAHRARVDGGSTPRVVAKTLCAALLADLRSDFNDPPRLLQRPANCLVLLDNADQDPAVLFLDLLTECRRESHAGGGGGHRHAAADTLPDPAVVVAVQHRRAQGHLIDPIRPTDELLDFALRHPRAPRNDLPVWWYPVELADLDREYAVEMCHSSALGSQVRDAVFLYALTGGHPEGMSRLGHLLAHFSAGGPYDPRRLLSETLPPRHELPVDWPPDRCEEPSVEDYLLKRLFPGLALLPDHSIDPGGNPELNAMAVLTATPGLRIGACNQALRYLRRPHADADTAHRLLVSARWLEEETRGGAPRPHPLAALLLRRWLARSPDRWDDVHQGYATHYAEPQDAPLRHHHALATVTPSRREPLADVAAYLVGEFARRESKQEWLALLHQVTAAPNRLTTAADPRSLVTLLAGPTDASAPERVVARLTVALWLHHDRCFDPAHRLAQLAADELTNLAGAGTGNEALYTEAGTYTDIATQWKA